NNIERPWGPGIILELGIYIAIHLGTKDIFLISYDLADPNQYHERLSKFSDKKNIVLRKKTTRNRILDKINKRFYPYINNIKYHLGMPYNVIKDPLPKDENRILVDSSKNLFLWLKSQNISLSVCSDQSYVSNLVPRLTIDQITQKLSGL
ncbi:MAG: hypothetical protein AB4372_09015, partial [Xenococcus sp. (in: cyanobacteria)]